MEYKYLLEILKQGLTQEFYAEFKNLLIPFQNPRDYGRSILENSSFLVSSAFPDKALHGNGYVARLSGSTAEYLQIWLIMNAGKKPFFLDGKKLLNLRFKPVLAGWLFKKDGTYSFNFLSKTLVVYHNQKKRDTFGKSGVKVTKIALCDEKGKTLEFPTDTIPSPHAERVRAQEVDRIDIYLE
jgi:hypothetical protein